MSWHGAAQAAALWPPRAPQLSAGRAARLSLKRRSAATAAPLSSSACSGGDHERRRRVAQRWRPSLPANPARPCALARTSLPCTRASTRQPSIRQRAADEDRSRPGRRRRRRERTSRARTVSTLISSGSGATGPAWGRGERDGRGLQATCRVLPRAATTKASDGCPKAGRLAITHCWREPGWGGAPEVLQPAPHARRAAGGTQGGACEVADRQHRPERPCAWRSSHLGSMPGGARRPPRRPGGLRHHRHAHNGGSGNHGRHGW